MKSKLPIAKAVATTYEIHCTKEGCREIIPVPGGSQFWTWSEIDLAREQRETFRCPSCGPPHRMPKAHG